MFLPVKILGFIPNKAIYEIAKKKKIDVPIMEMVYKMVYKIVYEGLKPREGFKQLMKLELSSEDGD